MIGGKTIALIIPARNEAENLPTVISGIPAGIDRRIVVDNGSWDHTSAVANSLGAKAVYEPQPGYGRACLTGLNLLKKDPPDIVAFADGDGSDDLALLIPMIAAVASGDVDFALAARTFPEPGALTLPQRWGNALAVFLIRWFWKHPYQDLGPLRAMAWTALERLDMRDTDYGWTVEMQIKALIAGLNVREFPTIYKKRIGGQSKVSRSLRGTLKAGAKILSVIGRLACRRPPEVRPKSETG